MDRTTKAMRRNLPERLATVRNSLGLSQRAFARRLGVFQQNINRYESGVSLPQAEFLQIIALKESISVDWLVLGRGRMKASRTRP